MSNIWQERADKWLMDNKKYPGFAPFSAVQYEGQYEGYEVYILLTPRPAAIGLHILLIDENDIKHVSNIEAYNIFQRARYESAKVEESRE